MDTFVGRWMAMNLAPRNDGEKEARTGVGVGLLAIVALEASLLGSGRMAEIGPLTLKMWLFLAAGLYVVIRLIAYERVKMSTLVLLLSFTVLLCFGATIGLLQGSPLSLIGEDVSPLLYCFVLCFVEMTMRTEKNLHMVVTIIKSAAIIISIVSVAVVALLYMGVISIDALFKWLTSDYAWGDFFIRGYSGLFFYTGSLYIAIGLIFFAFNRDWLARLASCVAILGLIVTASRGYALGLVGVLLVQSVTGKGGWVRRLRYFIVPGAAAFMLLILLFSGSVMGKPESDEIRVVTISQVVDQMTPLSVVFGHGLGVGVPRKLGHMEISYLEIFHKQGLLGLVWWSSVFLLLFMRYRRARRVNYIYAQPLFLSVVFLAVESATNPFVNSPIGIFVWIVALVGLDVISMNYSPARDLEQCNMGCLDGRGVLDT
jgi:uncharacterized membrane protein YuzA (DUF378 family)